MLNKVICLKCKFLDVVPLCILSIQYVPIQKVTNHRRLIFICWLKFFNYNQRRPPPPHQPLVSPGFFFWPDRTNRCFVPCERGEKICTVRYSPPPHSTPTRPQVTSGFACFFLQSICTFGLCLKRRVYGGEDLGKLYKRNFQTNHDPLPPLTIPSLSYLSTV